MAYLETVQDGLHVEECCSRLCLYPDYLLYAAGSSSWSMDFAMHILGEFGRELVVTGATAHIRLL